MNNSSSRKLAAILFADIVGYTSLMQSNERHALQTIQQYQSILSASAKSYNGQVLKNYGDGSLMIFQMTERFAEGKIKGGKSIFDSEGTSAPSEGGRAILISTK